MSETKSKRKRGVIGRGAIWCAQHPAATAVSTGLPMTVATSVVELGGLTSGFIAAGVVGAGAAWRNADPASWDRIVAPRLRAAHRRYLARTSMYRGRRWRDALHACDLYKEQRDGVVRWPRVRKLQAVSPSIDVLTVQLPLGISYRKFLDAVDELAPALNAEQLQVAKVKNQPRQVRLVIFRNNPFEDVDVDPAEILDDPEDVDFRALPIGEDELGQLVTLDLFGNHLLVVGRMGAGKAGGLWNPMRALAPAIREGWAVVDGIDPKVVELEPGRPAFRSLATKPEEFLPLVKEFRDRMEFRKEALKAQGLRKVPGVSADWPLNVLMIDELLMVVALSKDTRELVPLLIEIMSQGRALGFSVCAYIQVAEKDNLPIRDFFTRRICLAVATASHVDMTLGEGMRDRGAVADQILLPEDAGVGYMIKSDFKVNRKGRVSFHAPGDPMRIKLGNVTDADLAELCEQVTPLDGAIVGDESFTAQIHRLPTAYRGPAFDELELDDTGDGLDFDEGELEAFTRECGAPTTTIPAMVPSTLDLLDRLGGRQDPADVARGA